MLWEIFFILEVAQEIERMGYFEASIFLEHLGSKHHNPGVLCLCLEFENPSWHMFQEGNLKIKVGKKVGTR